MSKTISITGSAKEKTIRKYFRDDMDSKVPKEKVNILFADFELAKPKEQLSYGMFNAVVKKLRNEGFSSELKAAEVNVESIVPNVIRVEDLEFPAFKLHRSGKRIDSLFSDHVEGGGLYGGTVTIVVGESGVGKSTVTLDMLSSIQNENPDAKILYVSSEMTRNDILFYYKKTPAIGKVPTLLLMDYVKNGTLKQVLETSFNEDYDIILLDSFQDTLVKMKEVHNMRATQAESWLTGMMISAAEDKGCAILAIQHMTKGGTYVGSTYLKHATTSMMEIRFDSHGLRYVEFSKNRRGGSGTNKRLYYDLDDKGDVVYNDVKFDETEELRDLERDEANTKVDLSNAFADVFLKGKSNNEDDVEIPKSELTTEQMEELSIVEPAIEEAVIISETKE